MIIILFRLCYYISFRDLLHFSKRGNPISFEFDFQ
jgi:hypothetical protein